MFIFAEMLELDANNQEGVLLVSAGWICLACFAELEDS